MTVSFRGSERRMEKRGSTFMDTQRIREIRERLQATTPGAWRVCKPDADYFGSDDPVVETERGQYVAQTSYDGLSYTVRKTMTADAEFIAHAKDDIAYLLKRLEVFLGE